MDKKLLLLSFIYAVVGMLSGAVYREFTKFAGYDGKTVFSVIHTHMIVLGAIMFLLLFLFERLYNVSKEKMFNIFFIVYNIGLVIKFVTMYTRGTIQILGTELASGLNAAISGVAGLSHGLLGISLILLYIAFKRVLFPKK
jgi:hypothetical protein